MKAFFIDGDMRLVEVNGNVLVVYYPVEEKDSSLIMMNYSEGGLLKMYLKERRMERGVFVGKTTGTAYPLDQGICILNEIISSVMGMFAMRKPRGFNHSYIYVDERKEKLAKMEENAKRDLGMLPEKEFSPEDIRGKFIEGTTHLKRRK